MRHGFRKRLSGTPAWADKVRKITCDAVHAMTVNHPKQEEFMLVSQWMFDQLKVNYALTAEISLRELVIHRLDGMKVIVTSELPRYVKRKSARRRRWDEKVMKRREEAERLEKPKGDISGVFDIPISTLKPRNPRHIDTAKLERLRHLIDPLEYNSSNLTFISLL